MLANITIRDRVQNQDHKQKEKQKKRKPHSISRFDSVQDLDSDVLNCHGQKLAHSSKMQCQTNLHFYTAQRDVYLVSFYIYVLTM